MWRTLSFITLRPTKMKSTDWLKWNLGNCCKFLSSAVLNGTVLLLAVLSYNVGTGRLLGYGKHSKSRLLRKTESGDRNFYREFVSFCRYKSKVFRGLVKRWNVEFALIYVLWCPNTPLAPFLCSTRGIFLLFYSPFSLWMSNFVANSIIYKFWDRNLL